MRDEIHQYMTQNKKRKNNASHDSRMNESKSTLAYGDDRKNWMNDTLNESQTRFH